MSRGVATQWCWGLGRAVVVSVAVAAVMASGVEAVECGVGSYDDGSGVCQACPSGTTTLTSGATGVDDCVCESSSFLGAYDIVPIPSAYITPVTSSAHVAQGDIAGSDDKFTVFKYDPADTGGQSSYQVEFSGYYETDILLVGGGGGGSEDHGGGGGGGAVVFLKDVVMNGVYTITVGNGGAAEDLAANDGRGLPGLQSSILQNGVGVIADGGGGGGYYQSNGNGGDGGSGGGGDAYHVSNTYTGTAGSAISSTPVLHGVTGIKYGNDGANAVIDGAGGGGGGGGAGTVGSEATAVQAAGNNGGDGIASANGYDFKSHFGITNAAIGHHTNGQVYFGGGGGGGCWAPSGQTLTSYGGKGGGGNSTGGNGGAAGTAGTMNTGGGGGGGSDYAKAGGKGGSGIVIIRYKKRSVCQSCPPSTTTLGAGGSSPEDCVCMTASYENHPNLHVHYKFNDVAVNGNTVLNAGKLAAGGDGVYTMSAAGNIVVESGTIFDSRVRWTVATTGNFLSIPYQILDKLENAFTLSVWMHKTTTSDTDFLFLAYKTGTSNDAANKYIRIQPHSNGNLYFDIGDGGGSNNQRLSTTFSTSVMTHWAFTMERTGTTQNIKIFKDGVEATYGANPEPTKSWTHDFDGGTTTRQVILGKDLGGASLEDFRIYDKALTAEDILKLYNDRNADSGVCQACPPSTTTLGAGGSSIDDCVCQVGSYDDGSGVCQACPPSTTTLGAGQGASIDDCVCQTGSWSPVTAADAVVAWNPTPVQETADKLVHDFGIRDFTPAATHGFTVIGKFSMKSGSTQGWMRVFQFGSQGASKKITLGRNSATAYTMARVHDGSSWACNIMSSSNSDLEIHPGIVQSFILQWNQQTTTLELRLDGKLTYTACDIAAAVWGFGTDNYNGVGKEEEWEGSVYGLYVFNRYMPIDEAEAVLATIQTGALDDPLHTACVGCAAGTTTLAANASSEADCACESGSFHNSVTCENCPAATPYTDPTQAAEAEGDCSAAPQNCEVLDVQFSPQPSEAGDVTSGMVKYAVFTADSTITFPASPTTTVDVLVISHSFYRYVTNLEQVSGQYTITVAAAAGEESGFVGANSPGVTSGGGIEYLVPRWVLGTGGATCDDTCTPLNLQCDAAAQTNVDTKEKIDNIFLTEFGITCVDGAAGRNYAGTPFMNPNDNKCTWFDITHSSDASETASVCDDNYNDHHRPLCRCVPATTGFENAITGTLETYTTPQVVVQFHAIACGDDDSGDSGGPACTTMADPSVAVLGLNESAFACQQLTGTFSWQRAYDLAVANGNLLPTTEQALVYCENSLDFNFGVWIPTGNPSAKDWVSCSQTASSIRSHTVAHGYPTWGDGTTENYASGFCEITGVLFSQNSVTGANAKYITFPVGWSPFTVTFPETTTGEVLVVSGTEYAYDSSIDLPAGSYTVTVGAGESKVEDGGGVVVAGSAGGSDLLDDGVSSGLVAHWKFDGDGSASFGGYTLTMSGTVFESSGRFGQAVKFIQDANVVQTVSTIQIKPGTDGLKDATAATDVTFSMWVKRTRSQPSDNGNARDFIFSLGLADANYKLIGATFIQGNFIEFFSYGVSGLTTTETFTNDGSWVFLTFSRKSTKARRIYANGIFLKDDVDTVTLDTTGKLFIGRMNHQDGTTWFNQASRNIIDDFRVYNRVLTDAEITALYQAGTVSTITGTPTAYATPQVILRYNTTVCPASDGDVTCDVGSYAISANECQTCPGGKTTLTTGALSEEECLCPTIADPSVAPAVGAGAVEVAGAGGEKYLAFSSQAGAKYWRISNAGTITWRPRVGEIYFFSDSLCSQPINLNLASKTVSKPDDGSNLLSHAFDGDEGTYYRPANEADSNWDAYEIAFTFEFNDMTTVSCVRTTGQESQTYGGIGNSDHANEQESWDGGILLEASGDGSTWVTVAGPTTGSNDVAATGDVGVLFPFDYTVTFPNATTGEVLVVSGTEYAYDSSIDLPAGSYTVTVGAGESKVEDASGGEVARSAGGTAYVGIESALPSTSAYRIDGGGWKLVRRTAGPNWFQATDFLLGTASYGTYSTNEKSDHSFSMYFHHLLNSETEFLFATGAGDDDTNGCDQKWLIATIEAIGGTVYKNVSGTRIVISNEDRTFVTKTGTTTAKWYNRDNPSYTWEPILSVVDYNVAQTTNGIVHQANGADTENDLLSTCNGMNVFIRTGQKVNADSSITGTPTTYATPQVILRYNTTVCPAADGGGDTPTFEPTGNVTFLLAKGNVTVGDITTTLQSTIKTDIATALGITEADRVFIDHIKASPRRDKEVNMVVHVEHDATDRDTIAGKTAEVATAVKNKLNENNLNVCGCNAASLVNSEIQTSINC